MLGECERLPEADDKQGNKLMKTYSISVKDFIPPPHKFVLFCWRGQKIVLVTFDLRTNLKRISKFQETLFDNTYLSAPGAFCIPNFQPTFN